MEIINMEELINKHTGLIYRIMHQHGIYDYHSLFDDCFSAGKLGLVKAIQKWDSKKAKLTTHAYFYIRKEIQTCLAGSDTIPRKSLQGKIHNKLRTLSLDYKYINEHDTNFSMANFLSYKKEEDLEELNKERLKKVCKAIQKSSLTYKQKKALNHLLDCGNLTNKKELDGRYKTQSCTPILQKIIRHLKHS